MCVHLSCDVAEVRILGGVGTVRVTTRWRKGGLLNFLGRCIELAKQCTMALYDGVPYVLTAPLTAAAKPRAAEGHLFDDALQKQEASLYIVVEVVEFAWGFV